MTDDAGDSIAVSVVVPARDEAISLPALLTALNRQTLPPAEVIIVDAGSSDCTAEVARRFPTAMDTRVISAGPVYPGVARNAGAAAARNEWIAFLDVGCVPETDWLEQLVRAANRNSDSEIVYGSYEPDIRSFFDECAALAYVDVHADREGLAIRGPSVSTCMVRAPLFARTGGFPPFRAAEDLAFIDHVRALGAPTAFARAVVRWSLAPSIPATFRRFALYSEHNLCAGRGWQWHRGVARQYAGVTAALLGSILWWPLVLLVPLWLLTRIGRACWRKRRTFGIPHPLNPLRWPTIGAILLVIDAATLVGAIQHWRRRTTSPAGMPA